MNVKNTGSNSGPDRKAGWWRPFVVLFLGLAAIASVFYVVLFVLPNYGYSVDPNDPFASYAFYGIVAVLGIVTLLGSILSIPREEKTVGWYMKHFELLGNVLIQEIKKANPTLRGEKFDKLLLEKFHRELKKHGMQGLQQQENRLRAVAGQQDNRNSNASRKPANPSTRAFASTAVITQSPRGGGSEDRRTSPWGDGFLPPVAPSNNSFGWNELSPVMKFFVGCAALMAFLALINYVPVLLRYIVPIALLVSVVLIIATAKKTVRKLKSIKQQNSRYFWNALILFVVIAGLSGYIAVKTGLIGKARNTYNTTFGDASLAQAAGTVVALQPFSTATATPTTAATEIPTQQAQVVTVTPIVVASITEYNPEVQKVGDIEIKKAMGEQLKVMSDFLGKAVTNFFINSRDLQIGNGDNLFNWREMNSGPDGIKAVLKRNMMIVEDGYFNQKGQFVPEGFLSRVAEAEVNNQITSDEAMAAKTEAKAIKECSGYLLNLGDYLEKGYLVAEAAANEKGVIDITKINKDTLTYWWNLAAQEESNYNACAMTFNVSAGVNGAKTGLSVTNLPFLMGTKGDKQGFVQELLDVVFPKEKVVKVTPTPVILKDASAIDSLLQTLTPQAPEETATEQADEVGTPTPVPTNIP